MSGDPREPSNGSPTPEPLAPTRSGPPQAITSRVAILLLLLKESMPGRDFPDAIRDASGGFVSLSSATTYDTAQLLVEAGLIAQGPAIKNGSPQGGRNVLPFVLTDAGRVAALKAWIALALFLDATLTPECVEAYCAQAGKPQ